MNSNERKFLHDMANFLGTAMFLMDALLDSAQSRSGVDSGERLQMGQINEALEKMKKMIEERRELLRKEGVPGAGT